MNKTDLIKIVSTHTGESPKATQLTLNAALEVIIEEIKKGGTVTLLGFGTFYVGRRKERNLMDPRTREIVHLEEVKVARFIPGKPMKAAVKALSASL